MWESSRASQLYLSCFNCSGTSNFWNRFNIVSSYSQWKKVLCSSSRFPKFIKHYSFFSKRDSSFSIIFFLVLHYLSRNPNSLFYVFCVHTWFISFYWCTCRIFVSLSKPHHLICLRQLWWSALHFGIQEP